MSEFAEFVKEHYESDHRVTPRLLEMLNLFKPGHQIVLPIRQPETKALINEAWQRYRQVCERREAMENLEWARGFERTYRHWLGELGEDYRFERMDHGFRATMIDREGLVTVMEGPSDMPLFRRVSAWMERQLIDECADIFFYPTEPTR